MSAPDEPLAAVRTGVHVSDAILPIWQSGICQSLTQNLCLRRECHDWIEGFPEDWVFRRIGGSEDCAYNSVVNIFFQVGQVELETVEYVRRPGNSFDRQLLRFRHPPGSEFDIPSEAQCALDDLRIRLEDRKVSSLLDKWLVLGPPQLPASLLNWEGVLGELVRRERVAEALTVVEQAAQAGHVVRADLADALRRANRASVAASGRRGQP